MHTLTNTQYYAHTHVHTGTHIIKPIDLTMQVDYVDEGQTVTVRPDQLLRLPPKFQDIPPLVSQWGVVGMEEGRL